MARRRPWQDWELRLLAKEYPHCTTAKLAKKLKRSITSVYQRAQLSGLHKSELYLASPDACRLRRGDNVGATHRFLPGHAPANKGLRRPGWAPGRMAQTVPTGQQATYMEADRDDALLEGGLSSAQSLRHRLPSA
jgi:hypothetical protein